MWKSITALTVILCAAAMTPRAFAQPACKARRRIKHGSAEGLQQFFRRHADDGLQQEEGRQAHA
ncbi:MAG: hypothetical protein JWP03_2700 [Phycisphaerales bacterium]|nr:hypothetical protein [Phycisphaerales bacterium]